MIHLSHTAKNVLIFLNWGMAGPFTKEQVLKGVKHCEVTMRGLSHVLNSLVRKDLVRKDLVRKGCTAKMEALYSITTRGRELVCKS